MTYELASQQVSWSEVHGFVLPKLQKAGDWPMAGSPAWCELEDRDPVKWASLLDAAQHWVLRIEGLQQAECAASHAISASEDWSRIAHLVRGRADYLDARPWTLRPTCRPRVGGWMR
ncbi:DUF2742 domain-containing protein [Mycolicibacterium sp. jd]|uniref:DUF2742 domain-containing protein n=1 Tax=unclassified Mycolicibacterium TaxID=2636767 RepID=UPI00351B51E3